MKPYHEQNGVQIYLGDCREILSALQIEFDACITDPPYGLEFMGKDWDSPWRSWQSGGGFSKPGIGERKTDWPSFTATSRFGGTNPTCAKCGGRARGAKRCQCETPEWKPIGKRRNPENEGLPDDVTSSGKVAQMLGLEQWNAEWAEILLRVLKPGAMSLFFGGTRTHHRLMCGLEDAGFEIRDCLMWLYGSGFPKSLDIAKAIDKAARGVPQGAPDPTSANHGKFKSGCSESNPSGRGFGAGPGQFMRQAGEKQEREVGADAQIWDGYGTALKPAWEPIILAMKPCDGTFAENALEHGVAGLNIDGSRIGTEENLNGGAYAKEGHQRHDGAENWRYKREGGAGDFAQPTGRWPANLILDENSAQMFPEAPGQMADASTDPNSRRSQNVYGVLKRGSQEASADKRYTDSGATNFAALPGARRLDTGSAARFFYTAKADSAERGTGNNHPTVKPLDLMRYLCGLLCPPSGGILVDPFMGSGSTIIAARRFFQRTVGIEIEEKYAEIAAKRLSQGVLDLA